MCEKHEQTGHGLEIDLKAFEMLLEIDELKAENERLENLTAQGVHSCSNTCKRPMCVLRRENERLKKQLGISD